MDNLLVKNKFNEDGSPNFIEYKVVPLVTEEMALSEDNYIDEARAKLLLKNNPFNFAYHIEGRPTGLFTTREQLKALNLNITTRQDHKVEKQVPLSEEDIAAKGDEVPNESKVATKTRTKSTTKTTKATTKPAETETGIDNDFK